MVSPHHVKKGFIIAGPTASGKSALAMDIAHRVNGAIINADSMQLYQHLSILAAQPSDDDKRKIPHHLYGFLPPQQQWGAAAWAEKAAQTARDCWQIEKIPVVVGGTGFYLAALIHGLASIPDVPAAIRELATKEAAEKGLAHIYQHITHFDPSLIGRFPPQDRQRIIRAYEVLLATGQSISSFWQQSQKFLAQQFLDSDSSWTLIILLPEKTTLHEAAANRFQKMLAQGAMVEMAQLMALAPEDDWPIWRILGAKELKALYKGQITAASAAEETLLKTRQYIKRQLTWFRHQLHPDTLPANLHGCHAIKMEYHANKNDFFRIIFDNWA
ncbi:MAG: tRNA (adenosine(37)-N6)-dimethylallyltransferase MiaA [Alphaproteobacteria bacterium]